MGCEIELKAHVNDNHVDSLISSLKNLNDSYYLGEIGKYDIYWSHSEDGEPLFRTRLEDSSEGQRVLFTQKPLKSKDYCTEYNVENEFVSSGAEWDNVQKFMKGLNLKICRIKIKEGHHFKIDLNGFEMHCEVLKVKYLGWFIETEICGDDIDLMDKEGAEKALYFLLGLVNIPIDAVEPKGYNKMLKEVGHERG